MGWGNRSEKFRLHCFQTLHSKQVIGTGGVIMHGIKRHVQKGFRHCQQSWVVTHHFLPNFVRETALNISADVQTGEA